jgi:hypothetical protein
MFDRLNKAIEASMVFESDESPEALDAMEPGPFLAIVLSGIDVDRLPPADRVTVARAHQRLVSHYTAELTRDVASISDAYQAIEDAETAADSTATELRCSLHLTRRAADEQVWFALTLRDRLPAILESLQKGLIDRRRAWVLVNATSHCDDHTARAVVDQVIDRAPEVTTGELGALVRRTCVAIDPELAAQRYREIVKERRVVLEPTVDGTANLFGLDLPPDRAVAARQHIDALARSLRGGGEDRTMDQLRADVFVDLLCGSATKGHTSGNVEIRVDLSTLAGLDDQPGELRGYGPVVAEIARRAAEASSRWASATTDAHGVPVSIGPVRRRPVAASRRQVEATYPRCVFPGCRMPARSCDLDHTVEWSSGGPTDASNLAPLCRHDHVVRHRGWSYRMVDGGDVEWTSPLGSTYTSPVRGP